MSKNEILIQIHPITHERIQIESSNSVQFTSHKYTRHLLLLMPQLVSQIIINYYAFKTADIFEYCRCWLLVYSSSVKHKMLAWQCTRTKTQHRIVKTQMLGQNQSCVPSINISPLINKTCITVK